MTVLVTNLDFLKNIFSVAIVEIELDEQGHGSNAKKLSAEYFSRLNINMKRKQMPSCVQATSQLWWCSLQCFPVIKLHSLITLKY